MNKKIIFGIILMLLSIVFLSGCNENPRVDYVTYSGVFLGYYHSPKTGNTCIYLKTENLSNRTYCWWHYYDAVESLVKNEVYHFKTHIQYPLHPGNYPIEDKRLIKISDSNENIIWKEE